MSAETELRVAPLPPISTGSESAATATVEREIATLRFRKLSDEPGHSGESNDPVETSNRTAEVLRALFPGGVTLKSNEDFAFFNLLGRLAETIASFADNGMEQPAPVREIAKLTALLDALLPSERR